MLYFQMQQGAQFQTGFPFSHANVDQARQLKRRMHPCQICGKYFPTPSKLATHSRCHTGEKPFKCLYCGKAFAKKGNLTAHSKIHERV